MQWTKYTLHNLCCSVNSTHCCIFTLSHHVSINIPSFWSLYNLAPWEKKKNNKSYAINYPGNMASWCVIYTMCIKGHFRSAKCFNNSIHVNEVRSARSKERVGRREGGRGRKLASDPESQIWWWCCIFSSHYTVLVRGQSPLCAEGRKRKRKKRGR